jgi:TonB family protein
VGTGVRPAHPRRGRFQLDIDPATGQVKDVTILETTGLWSFDSAAVQAFRQWRFRPHTLTQFVIPMSSQ